VKRYRQTLDEILGCLSEVESDWMDEHSSAVIEAINSIPEKNSYGREDLAALLDSGFLTGLTTIRLALGAAKDKFGPALRSALGKGGAGVTRYNNDREAFLAALENLGALESLSALANAPVSWRDILVERLKLGRGSAITGQKRGRALEDFVERRVKLVFRDVGYDTRCRFVGAMGTSTEKADFAIPSKADPRILIECKAYGATGSKQTDILGDIERIGTQKRSDTHLLFVTDGITWHERKNDLRKLVEWQNQGRISRIYTQKMVDDLEADLRQLREDHSL
jgi:hypothetical protein